MTSWNHIGQSWKICNKSRACFNGREQQNLYWFYSFHNGIWNRHCNKPLWSHSGGDFLCYSSAEPLKTTQHENLCMCQKCDNSSCWQWLPCVEKRNNNKKKSITSLPVDKQSYFHFCRGRNRVSRWPSDLSMVTFDGNWTERKNRFPVPSLSPVCPSFSSHSKTLTPSQLQRFTSKQSYFM